MSIVDRLLPGYPEDQKEERNRLLGLMGMFFLVVTAVGILNPVRNSFALSGLGEGQFYKVYLVSVVVLFFVPLYNRLADRVGWRTLVPAVAVFFGLNLMVFRLVYEQGSTLFGLVFYGWYDLFAAALVTQFFVATQLLLNARSAKSAYPLVIGGGSIGAMLGGGIAGFMAHVVGTEDLLLVGALFILAFGMGIPFVWPGDELARLARERARGIRRRDSFSASEVRQVFSNSHVRLIALSVLLIVLTKQMVDYEFNTLTELKFGAGGQDAITAFQGQVNLATQWLPLVSVMALRPLLKRWGLGSIVFILPGLIFVTSLGMVAFFSIWTVIAVRTSDKMFRYSAERASREILYVPVPEDIKLKAKTYIDIGVEKGLGKALAAGLLALMVEVFQLGPHQIAAVVVVFAACWLGVTVVLRREYVQTLARSIRGRFASFQGLSALSDASTQDVVRRSLRSSDPVQVSFALDLVDQSAGTDAGPVAEALHELLAHGSPDIRHKALSILAQDPPSIDSDRVRPLLRDPVRRVREEAVAALLAADPGEQRRLVRDLLGSEHPEVRTAALARLARSDALAGGEGLLGDRYLEEQWESARAGGDRDVRIELALAAGVLRSDPRALEVLEALLRDPDPQVVSAALQSASMLGRSEFHGAMIEALRSPGTRQAAREALAEQGHGVVDTLATTLLDRSAPASIRRQIPSVLARIPSRRAAEIMLYSVVAPETDQLLDYRTLKALSQIRTKDPDLEFDPELVMAALRREVEAALRYERARLCLTRVGATGRAAALLRKSLSEAWAERQEGVFRLLGLIYPNEEIYRAYLAISGGERVPRANAIEWLEETLDRSLFDELAPVLGEVTAKGETTPASTLAPLLEDGDPWIARTAVVATGEMDEPWSRQALRDIIESGQRDELRELADRLLHSELRTGESMDLIEKVFLLQKIDLLHDARSSHLALLASIAEEVEVDPDTVLIRQDEPTDALYVVIEGNVELEGVANQRLEAGNGQAFGTWALIDEAPSLVTARVLGPSRLLRITRTDFYDLLADHSELALGLLQGLARRVRTLVA